MVYTLPELPYPYDALEPYYDQETVRIHHDLHHKGYVDGLNNAAAKLTEARAAGDYSLIKHWEENWPFMGGAHTARPFLGEYGLRWGAYRVFWPSRLSRILAALQTLKAFQRQPLPLKSGWGFCPHADRLEIMTAEKHQDWLFGR